MNHALSLIAGPFSAAVCVAVATAERNPPNGVYAIGPDQTTTDISKPEWVPLKLEELPPSIEKQ
jgi:hypothetical protein